MKDLSWDEIRKLFKIEANEVRVEFKGRLNSSQQELGGITVARLVPKLDQEDVTPLTGDAKKTKRSR